MGATYTNSKIVTYPVEFISTPRGIPYIDVYSVSSNSENSSIIIYSFTLAGTNNTQARVSVASRGQQLASGEITLWIIGNWK